MPQPKQTQFFKRDSSSYGGSLLTTRRGRARARPLATRSSMHLVLRSSKARGVWSFKRGCHEKRIRAIVERFAFRHGVRILSLANVGNHLHFHMQLTSRQGYKRFIRAITSAIAMAVTGVNRWSRDSAVPGAGQSAKRFWDRRPFTRIVQGMRAFLRLKDYMEVNQLEGLGVLHDQARILIAEEKAREKYTRERMRGTG